MVGVSQQLFSRQVASSAVRVMFPVQLTNREAQVASIAGRGYTSKYIANLLCMSARTVETHLGRIYGKLAIDNRDELIDYMRGVRSINEGETNHE